MRDLAQSTTDLKEWGPSHTREGPVIATAESTTELTIVLPDAKDLDQNEEFCDVEFDGEPRRIRFHDYAEIYKIPGMYEKLFAEMLECRSPDVITGLLDTAVKAAGESTGKLRVLDFGAGNGMVAEQLSAAGVSTIVGVDLLPEARDAALRDRPGLYQDYVAHDITTLDDTQRDALLAAKLNTLTCVAALGFDDVPPVAFAAAYNLLVNPGWVAFNLRDRFVDEPGPFQQLLRRMVDEGVLQEVAHERYRHRLSISGEALEYEAIIARKLGDIPDSWL